MVASGKLVDKRIAILAADGFEQAELERPAKALAQEGAVVRVIALRPGRIRGMHVHQPGELTRVHATVEQAHPADFDCLLVPGGYISPDLLRQSAHAREFVRGFGAAGKPIALLSQAPALLISAGLAGSRTLTAWPGIRDDVVNAGATWLDQEVVRDANCLFGRGPQDLASFVRLLIPFFAGEAQAMPETRQGGSDPQQLAPSEMPDQKLRWLSVPSAGTMLSLALLGVGVVAANHGRGRTAASGEGGAPPPVKR